jgi:hypothetical protein
LLDLGAVALQLLLEPHPLLVSRRAVCLLLAAAGRDFFSETRFLGVEFANCAFEEAADLRRNYDGGRRTRRCDRRLCQSRRRPLRTHTVRLRLRNSSTRPFRADSPWCSDSCGRGDDDSDGALNVADKLLVLPQRGNTLLLYGGPILGGALLEFPSLLL